MDPARPELVDREMTSQRFGGHTLRPIALLALADHTSCAAVRAELADRGQDSACVIGVAAAVILSAPSVLARASVFVVEDSTLSPHDRAALAWIRAVDPRRAMVLVTSAAWEPGEPWDVVIEPSIATNDLCELVEALGDRAATSDDAAARAAAPSVPEGFELRLDFPWPMVRCTRCSATRHCEPPRDVVELGMVIAALVTFGLAHEAC